MHHEAKRTYSPPADFELDTNSQAWASANLPAEVLADELQKFKAWRFAADRFNWNFAARKWLQRAIDRHGATVDIGDGEAAQQQSTYCYAKCASPSNPNGNTHGISLPESVAQRRPGEAINVYSKRVGELVTRAYYARRKA